MSDIRDIKPLGPAWPVTPADKDKHEERPKGGTPPRPESGNGRPRPDGEEKDGDTPLQIDEYA